MPVPDQMHVIRGVTSGAGRTEHQADTNRNHIGVDFRVAYVYHRLNPFRASSQLRGGLTERAASQTASVDYMQVDLQSLGKERPRLPQTQDLGTTDRRHINVERRMLL
jgi:hypothetical protein